MYTVITDTKTFGYYTWRRQAERKARDVGGVVAITIVGVGVVYAWMLLGMAITAYVALS